MMNRRSIGVALGLVSALALGFAVAPTAHAQDPNTRTTSAVVSDAVELTRKQIETERQAIVAENLNLTETESTAFWPMYREYMAERATVVDRRMKLITDYANSYRSMTDDKAKQLLDEAFATDDAMLKLKKSWAKKMQKSVSPVTTARFFQIEKHLDLIVQSSLADEIPLMVKGKPAMAEPVSDVTSK